MSSPSNTATVETADKEAKRAVKVKREEEKARGVEWRKTAALLGGVALLAIFFWAAVVEQRSVDTKMWATMIAVLGALLSYGTGRDVFEGNSLFPGK